MTNFKHNCIIEKLLLIKNFKIFVLLKNHFGKNLIPVSFYIIYSI
jgi:hypothetical protein